MTVKNHLQAKTISVAGGETAGSYDAGRGARLRIGAKRERADALVNAITEAEGGNGALERAFPALRSSVSSVSAEAVMRAAVNSNVRGKRTMDALADLVVHLGAAASTNRKRAERAAEMLAEVKARVPAEKLDAVLLTKFRALATVASRFDLARVAAEAVRDDEMLARLERVAADLGVGKRTKAVRQATRRADAYGAAAVHAAHRNSATLPVEQLAEKRSWRVEVVDTPEGSTAKPAFVVRIEANAPIGRLSRPARPGDQPALDQVHVAAAEEVVRLYFASMKGARLVGSYSGVMVDNGGGVRAHPLDVACASWAKLDAAMKTLLKVERDVVMEVCVYETPIEQLARRRDIAPMAQAQRAHGAVVQTLRCGLARLAAAWRLDLGVTQNVAE